MTRQKTNVYQSVLEDERAKSTDGPEAFESRVVAVAVADNEMLRSIHEKAPHKLLDQRERVELACIFTHHARGRTSVGAVDWGSRVSRRIYVLRHQLWYAILLQLAFVGLLLVAIWEPNATGGGAPPLPGWLPCTIAEIACVGVFGVDLCLALVCWRPRQFVKHPPNVAYALLVLCMLLDAIKVPLTAAPLLGGMYPFRYSRPLRPLLLLYLSKTCAHMVSSIVHTIPSLADLGLCVVAAVLFYALLSASLFGSPATAIAGNATTAGGLAAGINATTGGLAAGINATGAATRHVVGAMQKKLFSSERSENPLGHLHQTLIHLIMLLFTADNYPYVLFASYNCDEIACEPYVGITLFVSFIFFFTITLMSVFVAILFDVYKRQHGYVVLAERVRQRKALLAAFALLDTSGDGKLSAAEFDVLLHAVAPNVSKQSRDLAFRLLDKDDDHVLDQQEFLEVSDKLLLRLPTYSEGYDALSRSWPPARRIVESLRFEAFSTLLIVLYIALLLVMATDIQWTAASLALLNQIDVIFVIVFTVELGLKVVGISWNETWADAWNRLDLVVLSLSYVSMVLEAAFESTSAGVASLRALRLLRLLRLVRAMRAFAKISGASVRTRVLVATFSQFGRVVVPMVLILMAVSYTYAIIGMETLSRALDSTRSASWGTYCNPLCPSFDSLPHGLLTLFQVLIAANWSPLLEEAILNTQLLWAPTFFFLSYLTLCHVFMLSLLAALVLEVYAIEMDKAVSEESEDKMQVLCSARAPVAPAAEGGVQDGSILGAGAQVMLSDGVRRRFDEFDADHSGSLGPTELHALLVSLGARDIGPQAFVAALKEIDADGSGLVDFDEFLPWWRLHGLKQVFTKHDSDASGSIDATEFAFVSRELGVSLSQKELEGALAVLDKDGSGSISFDEFLGWFETFDMRIEFDKFDADKGGSLSRREFLQLLSSLGLTLTRKERDKVMSSLDTDGSGHVTFDEFYPWFKAVRTETKRFVTQGKRSESWEEKLFLGNDKGSSESPGKGASADAHTRQLTRAQLESLADELEAGRVPSRQGLMEMLWGEEASTHQEKIERGPAGTPAGGGAAEETNSPNKKSVKLAPLEVAGSAKDVMKGGAGRLQREVSNGVSLVANRGKARST